MNIQAEPEDTSVGEAISIHKEDRSYQRKKQKSRSSLGIWVLLLLSLCVGIGYMLYEHQMKLNTMQEWLSGDADNLEQIGKQLLQRSLQLEENIAALKKQLEATETRLKKTQARANNNRKVNQAQAKSLQQTTTNLADAVMRIATQETTVADMAVDITHIDATNDQQDTSLKALQATNEELLSFEKSTNSFRKTTNRTISDINQQLGVIRTRLDDIEARAVRHERLLITVQREQKQLLQQLRSRQAAQ